ncbi:IS110 family transposase [Sphingobium phenoxybenzoativorans]|uniref:IS110 family transposase n=1 Tax=Sphingobium phenoxybenzoativorans TaxID=1592790 RepID=UPI000871D0C3|nr:IS110 family transposase [Sphingobium phenoxybenzoativorans]
MLHQPLDVSQAGAPAILGCDVAKATIQIHDNASGRNWSIPNKPQPLAALIAQHPHHHILVEATGGYEIALIEIALAHERTVYRIHPNQARAFAQSLGQRAKTDPIDAAALALFGHMFHARLRPFHLPSQDERRLRQLARRRDELIAMRTQERNRLKAPEPLTPRDSMTRMLAHLADEIACIQAEIERIFLGNRQLAEKQAVLCAIKGLGKTTAHNLLATLPELGALSGKHIAALGGLAPHAHDSGSRTGYRKTGKGRSEVRRILFMATLAATRHNPTIKAFYDRLIANTKKPMAAIIACARKLLTIANAKIRDAQI